MIHLFYALIAIAALALTAWIGWPLRRTSPRLLIALLVSIPTLLLALYQITGTPAALRPVADAMPHSMEEAIAQLETSLQQHPDQAEGWILLARSHTAQGNLTRAREAWMRALTLLPDDPLVLTEAAQARAQADPQNLFDDDAIAMLERAIALEPGHQRAHWFIGVAQRQRGDDAGAAQTWEALLPRVDAATAASLREQINAARQAAQLPPLSAPPTPEPATTAPRNAHPLTVTVALSSALSARAAQDPDATVFIFARIPDGPPMPVAVERLRLRDLPASVTLDDSSSPMPTQTLSDLDEVEVLARLSASGTAVREAGDIDSPPVRVHLPHSKPLTLVIGDAP